ncbi:hypothetical protein [Lentzea sp. CA-135723]|uniref:hypothetical protein n=1 Tax=Lentzea sp. CA-135723 TaxID=3239950 RepID=UPI003D90B89E
MRKCVEESDVRGFRPGWHGCTNRCVLRHERPPLLVQFVVGLPQSTAERVVAVLGLPEDGRLPPLDVGERSFDLRLLGALLLGFTIVDSRQIGFEQRATLRTEHAVREEGRNALHDRVLADVDHLGMVGVPVGPSAVVTAR